MKRADGGESFNFLPLPFEFIHCRGESAALAAKCAGRSSGLHPPRNATTATAASGGNREQLLGQRPARRECRPRHEADAGCRNPSPRAARPFQTPRQKSKRKNASRFAKSIFRASPICRPLSRCGGSSPQGRGCALSVCSRWSHPPLPEGEARSAPAMPLALPLGELLSEAKLRGRSSFPWARMLPQGASASGCRLPLRPLP